MNSKKLLYYLLIITVIMSILCYFVNLESFTDSSNIPVLALTEKQKIPPISSSSDTVKVKYIELKKIAIDEIPISFQISELIIIIPIDNGVRVDNANANGLKYNNKDSDFVINYSQYTVKDQPYLTTELGSNVKMLFELKSPQNLAVVVVKNRIDCCKDRLKNVELNLYDENYNKVYKTFLLSENSVNFCKINK